MSIQFVPDVYTALETDDVVEVCVSVPGSVQLERPITYSVQTVDGTANGTFSHADLITAIYCLHSIFVLPRRVPYSEVLL